MPVVRCVTISTALLLLRFLHSASSTNYSVPRTRTKFGDRAFSVVGPVAWNSFLQQFAKQTACIRSSASSKLICSLCFNDWLSVLCIIQTVLMHFLPVASRAVITYYSLRFTVFLLRHRECHCVLIFQFPLPPNYVAAKATYIRLLHGKIGFFGGFSALAP